MVMLSGCLEWNEFTEGDLRVRSAQVLPGMRGAMRIDVPVEEGEDVFLVRAQDPDNAFVYTITDPSGREVLNASDWWESAEQAALGVFSQPEPIVVWPNPAIGGTLTPGTWQVVAYAPDAEDFVPVDVVLRRQGEGRVLRVHLIADEGLLADDAYNQQLQVALQRWQDDIYAPAGIELQLRQSQRRLPEALGAPRSGANEALYEDLSADSALGELVVVLGSRIEGESGGIILGVSGGIPGAVLPSSQGVVVISGVEAAGSDGILSEVETWILAETFAHEVGHFLGVFHPAEVQCEDLATCPDGFPVEAWDALDDTPRCGSKAECEVSLGSNLMFPYPVCDRTGSEVSCVPQRTLTALQQATMKTHPDHHQ